MFEVAGVGPDFYILNGHYINLTESSCNSKPAYQQMSISHPNYLYYSITSSWSGWVIGVSVCGAYIEARRQAETTVTHPSQGTGVWEELTRENRWIPNNDITVSCYFGKDITTFSMTNE